MSMKVSVKNDKFNSGKEVQIFTLTNSNGMQVEAINWGATLTKVMVPDRDGNIENVVLEWQDIDTYEKNPGCLGSTVGRVAGRIADAKVTLDNKEYNFVKNNAGNTLHGGLEGFHLKPWKASVKEGESEVSVTFTYLSLDGEENFPGNLNASITYTLKEDNSLTMTYEATTDKETIVNMTNHAYFNLSGNAKRSVLDQEVFINSSKICEGDSELIPSGQYLALAENKPFDFRQAKAIGKDISADHIQLKYGNGYDHIWVLDEGDVSASLYDSASGREMLVKTSAPGVVMYSMNFADDDILLSSGNRQEVRYGVCFETQKKAIGRNEVFKDEVVLKPDENYRQVTTFLFKNR